MKLAFLSVGLVACTLFGLGYLGSLHPMLDAIAIGRRLAFAIMAVCLAGLILLSGQRALAAAFAAIISLAGGAWFMSGQDKPGPLRIYSKNLLYTAPIDEALIKDIKAAAPDIVVLQEISRHNRNVLEMLRSDFPHQTICPLQGWNGMAVLSRWPQSQNPPRCSAIRSLMSVRINRPDAPFWVVNAHLQQPWPDYQWADLTEALWVIEGLDAPAVVAGDFNTVPWAAAPAKVGRMTRTTPVNPQPKTYTLWGVNLPLDQIWAQGGTVQRRPKFQSDHAGLFGEVWLDTPTPR